MSLFEQYDDKNLYGYSHKANTIRHEISDALKPIFDKYTDEGCSPYEIKSIISNELASWIPRKIIELRRKAQHEESQRQEDPFYRWMKLYPTSAKEFAEHYALISCANNTVHLVDHDVSLEELVKRNHFNEKESLVIGRLPPALE
jgi:hypothetical protein